MSRNYIASTLHSLVKWVLKEDTPRWYASAMRGQCRSILSEAAVIKQWNNTGTKKRFIELENSNKFHLKHSLEVNTYNITFKMSPVTNNGY